MSCLTEKTIGELLEYNFFIPKYQRGYRWTERQVEDLLTDIDAFIPNQIEKSDKKTWYCLQPIVIKECDEKTKIKNDLQGTWYEVIDGQQRLTSIFLIIHYANEMWIGKQKIPEFQIKYETRDDSFEFLQKQKIDDLRDEVIINYNNIDFHHITKAYNKIHNWVKNYKNKYIKEFDNNDFQSKLKSNSKVIWYEVSVEKDAIEIFTRINMGKIPLTNAELIKALFLNSSNFPNCDRDKLKLKQLEIASEWDNMEYSMWNEEFWYFFNNSENEFPTRIECIFDILYSIEKDSCVETKYRIANKIKTPEQIQVRVENGYFTIEEKFGKDQFATFRFFSEKFKTKQQEEIEINWQEIKRIYQTLKEWFSDRILYHKTGYLISTGTDVKKLITEAKCKQKKEFKHFLNSAIAEIVKCDNLDDLEYGKNNFKISNILLLHNIQTMLNNKSDSNRFPFNKYKSKKEGWSLEHIHAQHSKEISSYVDFIEWYKTIDDTLIPSEIKENVNSLNSKKDILVDIAKLIEEITNLFGDADIHTIENLALLAKTDNSSLNNSIFPIKREKIIVLEKRGSFIPICTKNVFQKYFDGCTKQVSKWEENDRTAYLNDIKLVVFPTK